MELLTEDEPVPGAKWIVEGVALGPHTTGACLGSQAQKDKRADALQKAGITHASARVKRSSAFVDFLLAL